MNFYVDQNVSTFCRVVVVVDIIILAGEVNARRSYNYRRVCVATKQIFIQI